MEVILKKYQKGLGEKNDIVKVKPGYARNYLIPQGIAILATEIARKRLAEDIRQAEHRIEHIRSEAQAEADKLNDLTLTIETLAGPDGKLFGAVTPLMVANRLEEQGYTVERQRISFEENIKMLGSYTAKVDVHKDVKATVNIEVVAVSSE
ncbi:MAG: 50S ribosomal protein L9 [Bacteroidota bacterium]